MWLTCVLGYIPRSLLSHFSYHFNENLNVECAYSLYSSMTLLKYYISYNTHFQIKAPAKQIQKGNVYHTRIHTYSHTYMHKCWSRILEQDQQFWRRDPSSQLVVILLTPKGRKVEQVLADVWTLNIKPQQKMLIGILPSMPMTLVTYHHAHECVCVWILTYIVAHLAKL